MSDVATHKSFCRFCHANCAIEVDVQDGAAIAVRGDPDDPVFGGYTCLKGRELHVAHSHPDRLRQSLKAGQPIATQTALDEIAATWRRLIDTYGPRSIAVYCGTYAFQNSAAVAVANGLCKGIGTPFYFTSVTLDQPAKVYTTARMGWWGGGLHAFSGADVVMIIGNNAVVSHYSPPGGIPPFSPSKRLRDAQEIGTKIICIDPRRSDVAARSDLHLPVKPGEDVPLLAAILNVILAEGLHDKAFCQRFVDGLDELSLMVAPFTPDAVAARTGVTAQAIVQAARLFGGAGKRGVAASGTGTEMAGQGTMVEHLIHCLNIVCGRFYREGEEAKIPRVFTPGAPRTAGVIGPMQLWGEGFAPSRFRGLTALGEEMPCNVLADEILTPGDGQIKALLCIGGNPVTAFPNQARIVEALDSLEQLVCIDTKLSQTARRADYVLAPSMCLEREDITILSEWWYEDPYARYAGQILEAPGDTQDEWELLWGLAKRLGTPIPLPGGALPMDRTPSKVDVLELITAGSLVPVRQVKADTEHGPAKIYEEARLIVGPAPNEARFNLMAGDVREQLAALNQSPPPPGFSHRLTSRRSKQFYNSVGHDIPALHANGSFNPAHVHPDDLALLGVADGGALIIEAANGQRIRAIAKASAEVQPGQVSISHGFGDWDDGAPPPGAVSINRLVDERVGYDPITGQSRQSAIPVRVMAAL
jgi:anaerobic selenocysteine-containing dehydrogenase